MISSQHPVSVAASTFPPASEYLRRNSAALLYPSRAWPGGCVHNRLTFAGTNARPGSLSICAASFVQSRERGVEAPHVKTKVGLTYTSCPTRYLIKGGKSFGSTDRSGANAGGATGRQQGG